MGLRTVALGLAIALGIAVAADVPRAVAQDKGTQAQRNACMGDAFRLCFWSIPNHKRIEACLKSKRKDLNAACHREVFGYAPRNSR